MASESGLAATVVRMDARQEMEREAEALADDSLMRVPQEHAAHMLLLEHVRDVLLELDIDDDELWARLMGKFNGELMVVLCEMMRAAREQRLAYHTILTIDETGQIRWCACWHPVPAPL